MATQYDERATELIMKQASKTAFRLHHEAQDTGDPNKYEQAAMYYEIAGEWDKADACHMAADTLRR